MKTSYDYHTYKDGFTKPRREQICLKSKSGKIYKITVHKLVMDCFGPKKPNGINITIDHRDRNPANNHISNLRYATSQEQMKNSSNRKSTIKFTVSDLEKIFRRSKLISLKDIAKEYKIPHTQLSTLLVYMLPTY